MDDLTLSSSEASAISSRRLRQQRLAHDRLGSAAEVVSWLGAVQAQDFHGAKWALALRMRDATDASIEDAFNDGEILRTHVLRPTWHFVTPKDIRWLVELTAPRVKAANASMQRKLQHDIRTLSRSNQILAKALSGRNYLTRAELAKELAGAGMKAEGLRLIYLIMHAELDGITCSGPRRGKQFTYALLDERAPPAKSLDRDEALGKLARLYFIGHGPATVHDFRWWSGLTVNDAKAGLEQASSELGSEEIGGKTYWASAQMERDAAHATRALLLPVFDELHVGYESFGVSRMGGAQNRKLMKFNSPVLVGARVVGSWKRELKKDAVAIDVAAFAKLQTAEIEAINAAAQRYAKFIGLRTRCEIR